VELDSVLVHVTTYEEMRRLTREGAEIWQEWRDGLQWDGALMRVPAAVAIRLCLIMKGAEFGEVAQRERGRVITPRGRFQTSRPH